MFQSRFDPMSNSETDRIAHFTYLAQCVCDLIAIPAEVVSRKFREYHTMTSKESQEKSKAIGLALDKCLMGGTYNKEKDLTTKIQEAREARKKRWEQDKKALEAGPAGEQEQPENKGVGVTFDAAVPEVGDSPSRNGAGDGI